MPIERFTKSEVYRQELRTRNSSYLPVARLKRQTQPLGAAGAASIPNVLAHRVTGALGTATLAFFSAGRADAELLAVVDPRLPLMTP